MKIYKFLIICIITLASLSSYSQLLSRNDSIIKGKIVPSNLTECFNYLDIIIKPQLNNDSTILDFWHLGIGFWIRNNWIAKNQNLREYFKSYGLEYSDRISGFIEYGYLKYLKGEIINAEDFINKEKLKNTVHWVVDGVSCLEKNIDILPDDVKAVLVKRKPNAIQANFFSESPLIFIVTKNGFNKYDSTLKQNSKQYRKLRRKIKAEEIKFVYQSDTILFNDLVGHENLIQLSKIETKKTILKINIVEQK